MKPSDFSVLLTRYLSQYLPVQRNLSGNAIKSYHDTFKLSLTFCRDEKSMNIAKLSLKQLDKKCIEDFPLWLRQSRGASPSTYNQRLSAIQDFFDYVMTEEPTYIEQCQKIIKIKSMDTPEKPAAYFATHKSNVSCGGECSSNLYQELSWTCRCYNNRGLCKSR
jgi:site-specific recombinase XerD